MRKGYDRERMRRVDNKTKQGTREKGESSAFYYVPSARWTSCFALPWFDYIEKYAVLSCWNEASVSASQCFTYSHHDGPQGRPNFEHFVLSSRLILHTWTGNFRLSTVLLMQTFSIFSLLYSLKEANTFFISRWCLFLSVCPLFNLWARPIFTKIGLNLVPTVATQTPYVFI